LLNSLKFLKVLKVSITTELKILTIHLGVVAAIRAVDVRIAATTPRLIVRILSSVVIETFKTFKNFKLFSNFNEVQTYSLMMIC